MNPLRLRPTLNTFFRKGHHGSAPAQARNAARLAPPSPDDNPATPAVRWDDTSGDILPPGYSALSPQDALALSSEASDLFSGGQKPLRHGSASGLGRQRPPPSG